MRRSSTRGPNRQHLLHIILAMIAGRGWFSAHQAASATYFGQGWVHPQQRKRVRQELDRYVDAGLLEHSDQIAACRLYRHIDPAAARGNCAAAGRPQALEGRLKPSELFLMRMLRDQLDLVVPRHANPAMFNQHGHLVLTPWYPLRAAAEPSFMNPLEIPGW